ncbi:hypothetical protein MNBD_UNCLBAC01-485 [hydrothermal vent metagenome]|uniref:histidine kinase n=1 Tax=hydrothermal vent metagenome TaxID=652676 RepID=A0A3B1DK66_9ZZZZ
MKLTSKISVLTVALLIILLSNTVIGLVQLSKIEFALRDVVNKDILLTEKITSTTHHQFKKAILFERVIRVAEEIVFETGISSSRKSYLIDHINWIRKGFDKLADTIDQDILSARHIVQKEIEKAKDKASFEELKEAEDFLLRIEKIHRSYESVTENIFQAINTGTYSMSFDDIKKIERKEKSLAFEIESLLEFVQGFTKKSVEQAKYEERETRKALWLGVMGSIILGFLMVFSIRRSIAHPLKDLVNAAHHVGEGKFDLYLDASSRDEIGDVSRAFNMMAKKLEDLNKELEQKNQILGSSLTVTKSQKQDLEKINKELDNFVYTVSHDIRAPLVGITGYGAYLENQYKDTLDAKGQKCVTGITRGAERLRRLIDDLLELTRIARIKNPFEKASVNQIVQTVVDRLEFNIQEAGVELKIQRDIPEIICDRIKLTEVFSNLIGNAVKFFSKIQEDKPCIEVGYIEQKDFHEFFVKDNGIGIAPEHHQEVFSIFKRLHNSQEYAGTGAGLSIVKGVIEDHGGKIWIESQLGKGATFRFTISKKLV